MESRKRRSKQLEVMVQDAKQRVQDHKSEKRLLDEKEKEDLEKKIDIYSRKLETLTRDLDDREIEKIMAREKLRNDRIRELRIAREEL